MCLWLRVLEMYQKNFKYLPCVQGIEVARPIISGFDTQKSPFSVFFAVFSGTAHELMVPAKPRNTHPRSHIMRRNHQLINSIFLGAERFPTFKMSPCIIKQIQKSNCSDGNTNGHWPEGYTKHSTPCFYLKQNPRYHLLKNRVFVMGAFEHISNMHYRARSDKF